MKRFPVIVICLMAMTFFWSCQQTESYEVARDQHYYYEIIDMAQNDQSRADIIQISQLLKAKKFAITPGSAPSWPFFKSIPLEANFPRDSILAPHTTVHKLLPLNSSDPDPSGIKVHITYDYDTLGQPVIGLIQYKWNAGQWQKLVDTGSHTVLNKHYKDDDGKQLRSFQTIIRYTFK